MNNCLICNEIFRKNTRQNTITEHYARFHDPPKLSKDGSIQINATHQIELILKGHSTWEQRKEAQRKLDKRFKRTDEGAWRAIEQLEKFEKENNIEFNYYEKNTFDFIVKESHFTADGRMK